jgi:hypothetical protein
VTDERNVSHSAPPAGDERPAEAVVPAVAEPSRQTAPASSAPVESNPSSLSSDDAEQPTPDGPANEASGKPAERTKVKPQPKSVLDLLQLAYTEPMRKLEIRQQDLLAISVDEAEAEEEERYLLERAVHDLTLAVPAKLLTLLAEAAPNSPAIEPRLLQLSLAAMASHPIFKRYGSALLDSTVEPQPNAARIARAVERLAPEDVGQDSPEALKGKRGALARNAFTALLLYRVLHDGWRLDRVIAEVTTGLGAVSTSTHTPPNAVALTQAQNSRALALVIRYYEQRLDDALAETGRTRAQLAQEARRADVSARQATELTSQLEAERATVQSLRTTVTSLEASLKDERTDRVADKSHLIDDYEVLRTRVIRQLSDQVQLLTDGLHALRHGSHGVADEFLDRALTAIQGEVTRLRDSDGGSS